MVGRDTICRIAKRLLRREDIHSQHKEIAWVHKVKKKLGE